MKNNRSLIALVFGAAFAVGLTAGCVVDFDYAEEGPYFCETDDDCVRTHVCFNQSDCPDEHEPTMTCMRESDIPECPTEQNGQPDTCEPDELGEDYPLDEPLDIQEVCDGKDNNCDGHVDVIFCGEGTMGCPSGGTDAGGNDVNYRCNEDLSPPQCEARPFITIGECNIVLDCVDGEIEETPEDCR